MSSPKLLCGAPFTQHAHAKRESMEHDDGTTVHRSHLTLDSKAVAVIAGTPTLQVAGDTYFDWAVALDAAGDAGNEHIATAMSDEQCAQWGADVGDLLD